MQVLSEVPGLGRVVMCADCEEVHVAVGRSSFRIPREVFRTMARMLMSAAAHPAVAAPAGYTVSFQDGAPRFAPVE